MANSSSNVRKIARLAILTAIIFLLSFTPLGYLVIGPIAATTIQMPVLIGAALMGPASGAVLGFFFGLSAIIKVLTTPGADLYATTALTYAPALYIIVCMGSRVLMGWLSGLLGNGLRRAGLNGNKSVIRYGATGLVGSFMNTVFYLGSLWLLCARVIAEHTDMSVDAIGTVALTVTASAGIPEAIVSCIIVAAVCKAVERFVNR